VLFKKAFKSDYDVCLFLGLDVLSFGDSDENFPELKTAKRAIVVTILLTSDLNISSDEIHVNFGHLHILVRYVGCTAEILKIELRQDWEFAHGGYHQEDLIQRHPVLFNQFYQVPLSHIVLEHPVYFPIVRIMIEALLYNLVIIWLPRRENGQSVVVLSCLPASFHFFSIAWDSLLSAKDHVATVVDFLGSVEYKHMLFPWFQEQGDDVSLLRVVNELIVD